LIICLASIIPARRDEDQEADADGGGTWGSDVGLPTGSQVGAADKEKLADYKRRYYEANKEKLAETQRRYREARKTAIADRL